ncbi:MAG: tetratricopeptide repeat protein [Bdellovibrionaceae bacterium]|nr:tetratricopeptide repeat protein [Pseudobdellovibrionaceae bacterium]
MRMGTDNRQEKSWLIKSSTRILGPSSVEEIAQMLLKKHISIIDEVRQPAGRWKYIREHAVFNETVDALRAEQENSSELTLTQTSTQTMTSHTAITKTDVISDDHTITPTPPPVIRSDLKNPMGSPGIKDVTALKETTMPSLGNKAGGGGYGSVDDRQVHQQVTRSQKTMRWIVIGLIVAVIAGVVGIQARRHLKKNEGYDVLIQQALRYKSLQLYDKSLAAYRKAIQTREAAPEVQADMAPILIVWDRQNVAGRRILEKEVQESAGNRNRMIDASLGIAISYILEGSLREAEDSLQKILVMEPSNFNARLNLGLIALRKGDWKEADRQLEDLTRRAPPHPLVLLGRGVSLLENSDQDDGLRARSLALEIQSFLRNSSQLRQELLLMEAALLASDAKAYLPVVRDFLMEVSNQSSRFARDLRLDWRIADWEFLERQCRLFTEKVDPNSWIKAMRAVCLAETGRESEARTALNDALAQGPRDPMVLFTQANLLFRSGLRNEAFAVLRVSEVANLPVAAKLLGRICLDQGDMNCAEKSFSGLMNGDQRDLMVIAGMAEIAFRQGDRVRSQTLIREGLQQEPSYLPLIELRETVSGDKL